MLQNFVSYRSCSWIRRCSSWDISGVNVTEVHECNTHGKLEWRGMPFLHCHHCMLMVGNIEGRCLFPNLRQRFSISNQYLHHQSTVQIKSCYLLAGMQVHKHTEETAGEIWRTQATQQWLTSRANSANFHKNKSTVQFPTAAKKSS